MADFENWSEVLPIADMLVRSARYFPDRDAVVYPAERRSYSQVLKGALHVARGLLALRVRKGEHVGLLIGNSIEFIEGFFGVQLAGAVAVPLNARHKTAELGYIINNAELVVLLTTSEADDYVDFGSLLYETLPSLEAEPNENRLNAKEAPHLRHVVLLRGDAKRGMLGRQAFGELALAQDPAEVERVRRQVSVGDTGVMLYTSGTTANPKGCALSHEAMTRGPLERSKVRLATCDHDINWIPGPLFHIGSLAPFLGTIGAAGTYVGDSYFHAGNALELLKRERVTIAWPWFPMMVQAIFELPGFDPAQLANLRRLLMIATPTLTARIRSLFPDIEIIQVCAMTETAGVFAISDIDETDFDRGTTQGKVSPGIEVRIGDLETGADLGPGEAGELLVRGYCVMQGYFRDPVKTAATLDADGWLRTGDLYSRNEKGSLSFRGRVKDMLKVGGENVGTIELETFLCQHEDVKLAEVVGMPDDRLDEVPVAFVELRAGSNLQPEQLIAFCKGKIANFKVPRAVYFVEPGTWPMSSTKIDKRALRARLPKPAAS